jgi:hypothetical protein
VQVVECNNKNLKKCQKRKNLRARALNLSLKNPFKSKSQSLKKPV